MTLCEWEGNVKVTMTQLTMMTDHDKNDYTSATKQLSEGSDLKAEARRPTAPPPSPGPPYCPGKVKMSKSMIDHDGSMEFQANIGLYLPKNF